MQKIYSFIIAIIVSANCFAQWSEVGGMDALAANDSIWSICKDPLGNIYAAGWFTNSSGNRYVAKWDGTSWIELGGLNGLAANNMINSITSDAFGNIYAVGNFTNGPSFFTGYRYVAKWNGTSWSELGGLNALSANEEIFSVYCDAIGNVYAAGIFTNSAGNYYVAKWNGTTWSELGGLNGLAANNMINSITSDGLGNIYAAGDFTTSPFGVAREYVAKWNGISWIDLGNINGIVQSGFDITSICNDDLGNIYAAITYGNNSNWVCKWNGTTWQQLGSINILGFITDICTNSSGDLFGCGTTIGPNNVVKWNGTSWNQLGGQNGLFINGTINCICSDYLGNVYVGGTFNNSSGNAYVAIYHDTLSNNCNAQFTLQADSALQSVWYLVNQCMGSDSLSADSLSYQWSWGDSLNSTSTGAYPTFTYSSPGNYVICVTITDTISGCTSTYCDSSTYISKSLSSQIIHVNVIPFNSPLLSGVAASSLSGRNEVGLYPNPFKDKLYYKNVTKDATITIYNAFGEVCLTHRASQPIGEVGGASLSKGIYFVKVTDANGATEVRKVVKE